MGGWVCVCVCVVVTAEKYYVLSCALSIFFSNSKHKSDKTNARNRNNANEKHEIMKWPRHRMRTSFVDTRFFFSFLVLQCQRQRVCDNTSLIQAITSQKNVCGFVKVFFLCDVTFVMQTRLCNARDQIGQTYLLRVWTHVLKAPPKRMHEFVNELRNIVSLHLC